MVYREIYSTQENDVTIKDKSMREINISKLTPGQTYSVDVYAVTTGDIRSQPLAQVNVTVGMYVQRCKACIIWSCRID